MSQLVNHETGELVETLSPMERSALTHAEATIEHGLKSFVEVGEALATVQQDRLYREDFGTFKRYCRERWGLGESRVYQLIDAAEVTSTIVEPRLRPVNEGQARELVGLEPEVAAEVMAEVTFAPKVTATSIREARERIAPRADHTALAEAAIAEFPDLSYYRDEAPDLEHCWRLAEKLRDYRHRGELDSRLDTLRRSIDLDRSKRNGTYVPTVAPAPAAADSKTCPTCGQEVSD